jgi:hypothetical protein
MCEAALLWPGAGLAILAGGTGFILAVAFIRVAEWLTGPRRIRPNEPGWSPEP